MAKLRKQRKRKKYQHNVNRKRLRNKLRSTGKIGCKEVKNAWEEHKSIRANLQNMGLSHDPNKTIKTTVKLLLPHTTLNDTNWKSEAIKPPKAYVAEALENEAKAPRERLFQLPNSEVLWVTYLLDKYGCDYKAMARDKKNYYQHTWKQIRAKIRQFKGVPKQFSKYLEERQIDEDSVAKEPDFDEDSD